MDTKKLRQKILDFAIRGKLVPQDPNDEPAIELLKRINPEFEPCKNEEYEELPKGWCLTTLGDVCSFISGYAYASSDYRKSGTPLIRISNINDGFISLDNCVYIEPKGDKHVFINKGDILIAMSGATTGKMGVYAEDKTSILNQRVGIVRVVDKRIVREKYRDLFLIGCSNVILKLAYGGAQPNISGNMIKSLKFPIPPYKEQLRIVAETEKWFAVIDELESNEGDLLKAIDQAKSKILDLAIHGKLVPQDPNDEPAIELLKRINPMFEECDNELDPTQLPDSWCWAKLESISTDSADGPFGSNLKKEHYTTNKEVRIIQLSNIGDEGWREENTKYTTFEHLKDISRSEVLPNDIVIAKMMPAGRAILCPNNEHKYVLSSDAVKFHIVDNIDCRYILYAINSEMFRKQVYENVQGVTRVRTSLQKLRKYCLPLPPNQEQLRIVAKIEELFSVLDSIKESLA